MELVNSAAYLDGRKLGDIRKEEIPRYLEMAGCLVWVALRDASVGELAGMQAVFGLHDLAVEDASVGSQRAKVEEYGNFLFAVVHTVEMIDRELSVGELAIFVGRNYVLSVRNRTHEGFANVRERCEREPQLLKLGAGFVMYALIDAVVDRYLPVIEDLEDEFDVIERRIFSGTPSRANVEQLYAFKQKLTTLHHAVGPLQEAIGRLQSGRTPAICRGMEDYFRDVHDHLLRINQMVDGLRDMVTAAITVNLSLASMHENETTKRLAAYAALVAVPTMIAGVYGMNFRHMPELEWTWSYPVVIGLMVAIDVYLFLRFRRSGWL